MTAFNKDPVVVELKKLIASKHLHTQKELCGAMQEMGYNINQSKVSRVLRRINAAKCKDEVGNVVYHLPKELAPHSVNASIADLVIKLDCNESMCVVSVSSGAALLIARILECHRHKLQMLGCIAGLDTVFVSFILGVQPADQLPLLEGVLFNSK